MDIKAIINLALCICAQDGVISELELDTLFKRVKQLSKVTKNEFELYIENFFSSELKLENYIDQLNTSESKTTILDICKDAASSDGLNINENIAYIKVKNMWGL